jgi:hypothetical protein
LKNPRVGGGSDSSASGGAARQKHPKLSYPKLAVSTTPPPCPHPSVLPLVFALLYLVV